MGEGWGEGCGEGPLPEAATRARLAFSSLVSHAGCTMPRPRPRPRGGSDPPAPDPSAGGGGGGSKGMFDDGASGAQVGGIVGETPGGGGSDASESAEASDESFLLASACFAASASSRARAFSAACVSRSHSS